MIHTCNDNCVRPECVAETRRRLRELEIMLEANIVADNNMSQAIADLTTDAENYRWMKANVKRIPPGWFLIGWDAAIAMERAK